MPRIPYDIRRLRVMNGFGWQEQKIDLNIDTPVPEMIKYITNALFGDAPRTPFHISHLEYHHKGYDVRYYRGTLGDNFRDNRQWIKVYVMDQKGEPWFLYGESLENKQWIKGNF